MGYYDHLRQFLGSSVRKRAETRKALLDTL